MPMTLKYFTRVIMKWNSNRLLHCSTDLKRVDEWFDKNKMQRNPSKYTAIIVFGNLRTGPPRFVCENTVIPLNEKVELLGVTIDKKLKFDAHVAKICR